MKKLQAINLSDVQAHNNSALSGMQSASSTLANMMREQNTKTTPTQSLGGAIGSAGGGAMAGAMVGAQMGAGMGAYGAATGAAVGLLSYYL